MNQSDHCFAATPWRATVFPHWFARGYIQSAFCPPNSKTTFPRIEIVELISFVQWVKSCTNCWIDNRTMTFLCISTHGQFKWSLDGAVWSWLHTHTLKTDCSSSLVCPHKRTVFLACISSDEHSFCFLQAWQRNHIPTNIDCRTHKLRPTSQKRSRFLDWQQAHASSLHKHALTIQVLFSYQGSFPSPRAPSQS